MSRSRRRSGEEGTRHDCVPVLCTPSRDAGRGGAPHPPITLRVPTPLVSSVGQEGREYRRSEGSPGAGSSWSTESPTLGSVRSSHKCGSGTSILLPQVLLVSGREEGSLRSFEDVLLDVDVIVWIRVRPLVERRVPGLCGRETGGGVDFKGFIGDEPPRYLPRPLSEELDMSTRDLLGQGAEDPRSRVSTPSLGVVPSRTLGWSRRTET